jgi:hypothetical protein
MCLSQDPESRSALKPVATRDPRKDPAVHVSLPSDAIVKQQRDSPQRTSFRTFSGPGTPSKSRSDAARTRTKPQFPQAPIPIETKTGEKPTSSPPSPLRKERQRSLFARNQTRHQTPPLSVAVDVLVGERRYRGRIWECQTLFEKNRAHLLLRVFAFVESLLCRRPVRRNKALVFQKLARCAKGPFGRITGVRTGLRRASHKPP